MAKVITKNLNDNCSKKATVLRTSGLPFRWLLSSKTIDKLEFNRYAVNRFVEYVSDDIKPGVSLLDAGAGECWYKPLFEHIKYRAIDFGKGDKHCSYNEVDIIGDLCNLPIKSECFDAVMTTEVLEHIFNPTKYLEDIFRILKPGGVLYLSVPFGIHEHQIPYDFYRYTSYGLRHLLLSTGFQLTFLKPLGGYFLCVGRLLFHAHRRLYNKKLPVFLRGLMFPFRPLSKLFFRLLLPLMCYKLDRYDDRFDYTLGYACKCTKPGELSPCKGKTFIL